ncbi:histidine phosphatase family protein [Corynebacterium guangdongense]|uniref:Phosphoglycerate mutase n=1 Tax=Corynebacterium guangdongense TaxID=1783348 RepID=A0ABU1ZVL1_9CORY|nr:histidine phosphatase family protein [Corynebacterium guangdongense]MDR7328969.1 putative phosphoglycerate mutase [Corynebacterium guangdongense]WJZ17542.1 Phosphoserine phosphatase 1 [Corynebacterium guangdongense]
MTDTTPVTTLILLVRHGATPTTGQVLPGRAPGLHLAERGDAQAREVAERLEGLALDAIYSSPMERAQETAAPTAAATGLDVRVDKRLIECEFGEWTGAKLSDLYKLPEWQTVQQSPSQFRFPGGESFVEMQERMVSCLLELADRHRGGRIALFSHADPLKALVAWLQGSPLDAFQKISIDTGSVSAARIADDGTAGMVVTNSRTGSLAYLGAYLGDPGERP